MKIESVKSEIFNEVGKMFPKDPVYLERSYRVTAEEDKVINVVFSEATSSKRTGACVLYDVRYLVYIYIKRVGDDLKAKQKSQEMMHQINTAILSTSFLQKTQTSEYITSSLSSFETKDLNIDHDFGLSAIAFNIKVQELLNVFNGQTVNESHTESIPQGTLTEFGFKFSNNFT